MRFNTELKELLALLNCELETSHFPKTILTVKNLVDKAIKVATSDGIREVVIASAFFPGNEVEVPPIHCDANAYRQVWGSSDINKHGESLLEYLLCYQLDVSNVVLKHNFINAIWEKVLSFFLSN